MDEKQRQQIRQFLDAFLRRKKIIFSSFLLAVMAGVAVYLVYPKSYLATALIMYQRQKVNPTDMSPDYKAKFIEIITNLSQQITSRPNLENLINRFDLYPEARKEKLMADIVATMRKAIQIVPEAEGDVFHVSYEGRNPQQVMRVTNALASEFIEENLQFREKWTSDNLSYIKNELTMAKRKLDKKEKAMRDFKIKYYNEMPEQREANMARLTALQSQYQHLQSSIQDQERTRVLTQEQLTLREKMQTMAGSVRGQHGDLLTVDNSVLSLAEARRKLILLEGRYTARHPDVVRLKALIREMERSRAAGGGAGLLGATPQEEQATGSLALQIKDIDRNIGDLRKELAQTKNQMAIYQGWIEKVPKREAQWTALTRDYTEFRKYYDTLVSRSLQAGSAETLEKQQKGSQFRIVDAASLPDRPFRPNFLLFLGVSAVAGLGLGGGISYLLEASDSSFKDAADLESYLGLPVTCSIPLTYTDQEKRQLKMRSRLWAAAFAVALLIITSGIITLWFKQLIII